jgi:hypothetical protein
MLIDCDTCSIRGAGCGDCVITVLVGAPPARAAFDDPFDDPFDPFDAEVRRAIAVLADAGLVERLQACGDLSGFDRESS